MLPTLRPLVIKVCFCRHEITLTHLFYITCRYKNSPFGRSCNHIMQNRGFSTSRVDGLFVHSVISCLLATAFYLRPNQHLFSNVSSFVGRQNSAKNSSTNLFIDIYFDSCKLAL